MKRFRFPLERVLRHRALREALAEQALGAAVAEAAVVAQELAQVRDQIAHVAGALCGALADSLQGSEVALHARYAAACQVRQRMLRERQATATARIQECRTALRECRRAREAVAQLKHAAWERYGQAVAREAQVALDEVAATRHARLRIETEV
jgi:flagellar export protein FliJ